MFGHLCHLAFDFWAFDLFAFVPFGVWLLAGEVLVRFDLFVWFERTDIQTARANMGTAHSKVPHSTWEPFGKQNFFDWPVYSYDKKNSLKTLDLYWHRIGKWTEVPLCLGLPPEINSLGLIKLRPLLPQRDNPCWRIQSALVVRAKLSTIWSKFWL